MISIRPAWFNAFLWKARLSSSTQVIFAHMFRDWEEPSWLMEWWTCFGLNPVNINPEAVETQSIFPQWHRPLNTINDLYSEEEFKSFLFKKNIHGFFGQSLCYKKMKMMIQNFYDKYIHNIGIHTASIISEIVLSIERSPDGRQWCHPFSVGCRYQLHL
jgi:hypothetical protein